MRGLKPPLPPDRVFPQTVEAHHSFSCVCGTLRRCSRQALKPCSFKTAAYSEVTWFSLNTDDDYLYSEMVSRSGLFAGARGGTYCVRGAIGRTGHVGHNASASSHTCVVDIGTAGAPLRVSDFGLHGRDGRLQSWYGIGQSLLMLPADVVGTYVERLPVFAEYRGNDPTVRNIIVSYSTNIFLCVLTLWFASISEAIEVRGETGSGRRYGSAAGNHTPPLHAEPDGEQLHFPADSRRAHVSI